MAPDGREVVMSYIEAMDRRDFAAVRQYLQDSIFIKGPAGEAFRSPDHFLKDDGAAAWPLHRKKVFVGWQDRVNSDDFRPQGVRRDSRGVPTLRRPGGIDSFRSLGGERSNHRDVWQ